MNDRNRYRFYGIYPDRAPCTFEGAQTDGVEEVKALGFDHPTALRIIAHYGAISTIMDISMACTGDDDMTEEIDYFD